MQRKLRREILKKWAKKMNLDLLPWEKCPRCGKIHKGYDDVTEKDFNELIDITVKAHESRRGK